MARSLGPIGLLLAMIVWAAPSDGHARSHGADRLMVRRLASTITHPPDAGAVVVPGREILSTERGEANETARLRFFYVGDLLALEVPVDRIESWIDGAAEDAERQWRENVIEIRAPLETLARIEAMLDSRRECVRRSLRRSYVIKDILDDLRTLRRRDEAEWGAIERMMNRNDDPQNWPAQLACFVAVCHDEVVWVTVRDSALWVQASPSGHVEIREFFREYRESVAADLAAPRPSIGESGTSGG